MNSSCEKHDRVDFAEPKCPRNPSLNEVEDERQGESNWKGGQERSVLSSGTKHLPRTNATKEHSSGEICVYTGAGKTVLLVSSRF